MRLTAVLFGIGLVAAGAFTMSADADTPVNLFDPGNYVDADGTVRNRAGQRIGKIEAEADESHVLRNNDGHPIGRVERGFNKGELVIRSDDGRRQGTLERREEDPANRK